MIRRATRQLVGVETDDGDADTIVRDVFGRETAAQNSIASYAYMFDDTGVTTNETVTIGGEVVVIRRGLDDNGRIVNIGADKDGQTCFVGFAYRSDGRLNTVTNCEVSVAYAYSDDGFNAGYTLSVSGGATFTRTLTRDLFRRDLVTDVANGIGAGFTYAFDALGRPVSRNCDSFAYDARGQVTATSLIPDSQSLIPVATGYSYDNIGNLTFAAICGVTNNYAANAVNEYVSIESAGTSVLTEYDAEGNLTAFGEWTYAYDAQNRLTTVSSNGLLVATNFYDHKGRRVRMVTQDAAYTFAYDGWNIVLELIESNGQTERIEYYWGKDISGTMQDAGGIGGLLYLKRSGTIYVPIYDAYGNVTEYRAADGSLAASYTYDAFGRTIAAAGPLADVFRHRHATKCYEHETGLYYYGYRHYFPSLARWLTPDPVEEEGGLNLYGFCGNNGICRFDSLGMSCFGDCFEEWRLDWGAVFAAMGFASLTPVQKAASELHAFGEQSKLRKQTSAISKAMHHVVKLANSLKPTHPATAKALQVVAKNIRWLSRPLAKLGLGYPGAMISTFEVTYDVGVTIYCGLYCASECDCGEY